MIKPYFSGFNQFFLLENDTIQDGYTVIHRCEALVLNMNIGHWHHDIPTLVMFDSFWILASFIQYNIGLACRLVYQLDIYKVTVKKLNKYLRGLETIWISIDLSWPVIVASLCITLDQLKSNFEIYENCQLKRIVILSSLICPLSKVSLYTSISLSLQSSLLSVLCRRQKD